MIDMFSLDFCFHVQMPSPMKTQVTSCTQGSGVMVAMDQSMEYVTSAVSVQTMTCALLAKVMGTTWSTSWLQSRV